MHRETVPFGAFQPHIMSHRDRCSEQGSSQGLRMWYLDRYTSEPAAFPGQNKFGKCQRSSPVVPNVNPLSQALATSSVASLMFMKSVSAILSSGSVYQVEFVVFAAEFRKCPIETTIVRLTMSPGCCPYRLSQVPIVTQDQGFSSPSMK